MWLRRRTRSHSNPGDEPQATLAPAEVAVLGEARAVIEGRVIDALWAEERPIPPWAWLNALAHRPAAELADLVGLACNEPSDRWAGALIDIAADLRHATEAAAEGVRAELLVPAELEALVACPGPDAAGRLVRGVRRRLTGPGHRPPPNPPKRAETAPTEPNDAGPTPPV